MCAEITQRCAEISLMCAEIPQRCAEISQMYAEITQRCAEISQMCAEIPQRCAEISQMCAEIPQRCAEISQMCAENEKSPEPSVPGRLGLFHRVNFTIRLCRSSAQDVSAVSHWNNAMCMQKSFVLIPLVDTTIGMESIARVQQQLQEIQRLVGLADSSAVEEELAPRLEAVATTLDEILGSHTLYENLPIRTKMELDIRKELPECFDLKITLEQDSEKRTVYNVLTTYWCYCWQHYVHDEEHGVFYKVLQGQSSVCHASDYPTLTMWERRTYEEMVAEIIQFAN
jgi:hypothetical protein